MWRRQRAERGFEYDSDSLNGADNEPAHDVNWANAMGYCRWLNERLQRDDAPAALRKLLRSGRWQITLPSELEWEVRHEVAWRPVARSKEMPPDSLLSASYLHRRRRQRGGLKLQGQCSLISKDVTRMSVSYTL